MKHELEKLAQIAANEAYTLATEGIQYAIIMPNIFHFPERPKTMHNVFIRT